MASMWVFHCTFGLSQDTCGEYEEDEQSRGKRQRFDGCASCLHRLPATTETRQAEDAWDVHQTLKP